MDERIYKYRWQVLLLLVGLILAAVGIVLTKPSFFQKQPEVEVVSTKEDDSSSNQIVVEVAGSVQNPNLFEFDSNARIGDAIKKAGGLSDDVDLEWVEKNINQAAKLTDGQKIYIPSHLETESAKNSSTFLGVSDNTGTSQNVNSSTININTATQHQLESLWGIGPATAKNIIDNRPYSTVEELHEKGILKNNVYERNKDLLTVF